MSAGPGGSAWAAGFATSGQTLIVRWNGTAWSRTASPSPGSGPVLRGVSAGPDGSTWAAGYTCGSGCGTSTETDQTLILRWNGAAWTRAASPSPGSDTVLNGVSAAQDGSAWAAGDSCTSRCPTSSPTSQTLILHWDGAAWTRTASPSPGSHALLLGVSAGPGGSAWAAGDICTSGCGTPSAAFRTLILHWDGATWTRTASPTPDGNAVLTSVSAGPDGSAWAAGWTCAPGCLAPTATYRTLILHWNGAAWTRTPSPSPGSAAHLFGVAAGTGDGAWAAGRACTSHCNTSTETDQALILHWDGAAWTRTPSPSPGSSTFLYGVSAGSGNTAWAAGRACTSRCGTSTETDQALILHWDGAAWTAR